MAYNLSDVVTYVKENSQCELISQSYKTAKDKLVFKCWKCGEQFEQSFSGFMNSLHKSCRKCRYLLGGAKKAKTTDEFKKDVYELEYGAYEVVGEYVNASIKIDMMHMVCGHVYSVMPRAFLDQGHRCPQCNPKRQKTNEEFKLELFRLVGSEYTLISVYRNALTKVDIRHESCGNIWSTLPINILSGTRCPSCYRSKGEERVELYLSKIGVNYGKEKTFSDCAHIGLLRFDFYLPKYNACIEYDGEHHFKPCGFGEKDHDEVLRRFEATQKRDRIKNDYCKDNNIPLLRIPYTEFNSIEVIISDFLHSITAID